ncbi:hypothetical protein IP92_04841 [Pseudoduganella flava]|uniref:CzcE family metal-binding protein n=1 Tax=Pseudoduganella flava TaxID=871742 RepID=A0A562PH72_9BURK|nr:hypothetical protein [Pseudoduganella flava]QGZ42630.1 hypothetical protein GO485_28740 [Pseudoduganella flava]TWI43787.1 hypothetical protein IP92_04841 [Pseudoduganella flava]
MNIRHLATCVAHRLTAASLLTAVAIASAWAQDRPATNAADNDTAIGYRSVAQAFATVPHKPGAEVRVTPNGWTIVSFSTPETVVWSFAPADHYAAPAVVRRTLVT